MIHRIKKSAVAFTGLFLLAQPVNLMAQSSQRVSGVVYQDENTNGRRDKGEPGVPRVRVSNGRDVTLTDGEGSYRLPIDNDDTVFVIKPSGYRVPRNKVELAQFYYVHNPDGSAKDLKFKGVEPTGDLPESVDFPLVEQDEPKKFRVVLMGDPQPRDLEEVGYLARDIVPDMIGMDAAFGISLGDIAFNDLSVLEPVNEVTSSIGIPWYYVHGNHDMNFDVPDDKHADETWERIYGPTTYSFDYGDAHFIIIDDVLYEGEKANGKRGDYHGEFTQDQLAFVRNDLKYVPKDKLVVFSMHIPLEHVRNHEAMFLLFDDRPNSLAVSAHMHYQKHVFFNSQEGWHGAEPLHELVAATACGSWFRGVPDELGIPHAMMRDGAPNGYNILAVDGTDYSLRFVPTRRPKDHQMNIFAADEIASDQAPDAEVVANFFAGSEKSRLHMRVDRGPWSEMEKVDRPDPYYARLKGEKWREAAPSWRKLPKPIDSPHLWAGKLARRLSAGPHVIEVRAEDMFGQVFTDSHVLRVTPADNTTARTDAGE